MLYKGKGKLEDPNNWRGICFKRNDGKDNELNHGQETAKEPGHLDNQQPKPFWAHRMPGSHTHVWAQPVLRRQHSIKTFAIFADLVNAFDTINHSLLLQVLTKHGIPPKVLKTIEKLYTNCKVQLTMGKEKCEIEHNTGVQQGENTVPIMFLYIMQAAIQALHLKLTNIKVQFRHFLDQKRNGCQRGRPLVLQNSK